MRKTTTLTRIVADELENHACSRRAGEIAQAWRALERAHIVLQPRLGLHMRVHVAMLAYAIRLRQPHEIGGQLVRLALAPVGAITGRIPWSNTGRSDVSAFQAMPISPDLAARTNDNSGR